MNYLTQYGTFVQEMAQVSGKLILSYFRHHTIVSYKDDNSPVTLADRQAEEIMRNMIQKKYPQHGILGEELGSHQPNADFCWILDPIDGTKSFICGTPTFATLIALTHHGKPVLGAIHQPVLGDLLLADNNLCLWNNKKVQVQDITNLNQAITLVTDILHVEKYQNWAGFHSLMQKTYFTRTWGDAYGYFLLATGQAHIMIDPILQVWDLMALIPVIRGAGGCITNYQGGDPLAGNSVVAAVPSLHQQVIQILNENSNNH